MYGGKGDNAGCHRVGRTDEDRSEGLKAADQGDTGLHAPDEEHVTRQRCVLRDGFVVNKMVVFPTYPAVTQPCSICFDIFRVVGEAIRIFHMGINVWKVMFVATDDVSAVSES